MLHIIIIIIIKYNIGLNSKEECFWSVCIHLPWSNIFIVWLKKKKILFDWMHSGKMQIIILVICTCPNTAYYVWICSRFHTYNAVRASESVPAGVQFSEDELYARPHEVGQPKVTIFLIFLLLFKVNWCLKSIHLTWLHD